MAITGMRMTRAEVTRMKNEMPKGISINMTIENVKPVGNTSAEITFIYAATYADDVGTVQINGVLFVEEEKKKRDQIVKEWKESKKLPDDFAEEILNNINFACGANGTLMARVVNLQPPMLPPRIKLGKGGADASAA